MISWIAAAALVGGFLALMRVFGLVERSQRVVNTTKRSLEVIRSSSLSDDAKEATLQQNAKTLFRLFFALAFGGAAALLLPLVVLKVCDLLGWLSFVSVLDVTLSPVFLVTSCVLAILLLRVQSRKTTETAGYSGLDRILHRVAFRTYLAQVALADIETLGFAKRLAACKIDRPIFITALPRAGTTLLLECCAGSQEFASHCYRDMPFVLIPCLWNRFSAFFQQSLEPRERSHGDGMLISPDSPEALEEVAWKTFWRRHYRNDRILPWKNETDDEFETFFRDHMRKIIFLRRDENASESRYVSKNNLNIGRIRILRRLFPGSVILVPFRQPRHHAASLLQQHRNFLRIHDEDPFASEYMRAIGHYDFGENLRPIDFDGWLDARESSDTDSLTFWLNYWVVSYRHLLSQNADSIHFLGYEALCEDPERGLQRVADAVESRDADALRAAANGIHPVRPREVDTSMVPEALLEEADDLHAKLVKVALNYPAALSN